MSLFLSLRARFSPPLSRLEAEEKSADDFRKVAATDAKMKKPSLKKMRVCVITTKEGVKVDGESRKENRSILQSHKTIFFFSLIMFFISGFYKLISLSP